MCPSPPRTIRYYSLYQTNVYFYSIFLCSPSFIPFSLNVDVLNMMLTCHVPLVRTAPGTSSHVIRLCSHTAIPRSLSAGGVPSVQNPSRTQHHSHLPSSASSAGAQSGVDDASMAEVDGHGLEVFRKRKVSEGATDRPRRKFALLNVKNEREL